MKSISCSRTNSFSKFYSTLV